MGYLNGPMALNMRVTGETENKMEKENLEMKKVLYSLEYGEMENLHKQ